MRRLLVLLLFVLVLAGGAVVTWKAMGQAKLVQEDLTTARALLARAGGFQSGELDQRLELIDQARAHTTSAQQRLQRWPLRHLGVVPVASRDVRVAQAVASSATRTARATRQVVTTLQPVQTKPPPRPRSSRPPTPCWPCTPPSTTAWSGSAPPGRWSPGRPGTSTWRRPPRPASPPSGPARASSWPPACTARPAAPAGSWPSEPG